jgi:hypothetical protein
MASAVELATKPLPPKGPPPAEQGVEPGCLKRLVQSVIRLAIQVLVPLSAAFLACVTLPLSISAIVVPVATVATIASMFFFFDKPKQAEPVLPLSRTAPLGLRNAGNDCWLNSLCQILYIDRGLKKWFSEVPNGLDRHVDYFPYFDQDLIENLPEILPEEFYQRLQEQGNRQVVDRYAAYVRQLSPETKERVFSYLRVLRRFFDLEGVQKGKDAALCLLEFKKFMNAYDAGMREERPGQVLLQVVEPAPAAVNQQALAEQAQRPREFDTHQLRDAIARAIPQINLVDGQIQPHSQQDASETFNFFGLLLPENFNPQMELRKRYELPRNVVTGQLQPLFDPANDARQIDDRTIAKEEPPPLVLQCSISGSYPNRRDLLNRSFKHTNHDLDNRITRELDGVTYCFRLAEEENQYLKAPDSIWVGLKRFVRNTPQWEGLHRVLPKWFDAAPPHLIKLEDPVECQETVEIEPTNGPTARYKLDGFICHQGKTPQSGHYISYKLGLDDEDKPAWFQMNDSRVTRVSDAKMRSELEKAYMIHYSKIEIE